MSTCIKSKQDSLEVVLNGKGCLVCLAKGQMEQLLTSQALFARKGNNEDTLLEGCPSLWCHRLCGLVRTTLHVPFFE
ncbi:hypothetical protein RchiOBHm_Chr4g0418021 [Rosa chinensis]|uniref:Uncharacterized protein n=1 Tax=Rosa chinensis TaxID=74649 RepID=A0A2P6QX87_ROSCH|nr:hypothetical protein RchiOBHm_Chr4g0418021 [Rosa chinensis]